MASNNPVPNLVPVPAPTPVPGPVVFKYDFSITTENNQTVGFELDVSDGGVITMKNATYTDSVISFISMMDFINFIAKQLHGQHYKSINVNLIK